MAYSTINSVLGGAGVRRTHRQRQRADQAAARQASRAAAQSIAHQLHRQQTSHARHARQRVELHTLANEIIPTLQQRAQALSTSNPLHLQAFGSSEYDRQQALAHTQQKLSEAQARADKLAGQIRTRRGRRAPPISPLEATAALVGAIPPVRAGEGLALGGRALLSAITKGGEGADVAARAAATTAAKTAATRGAGEVAARQTISEALTKAAGTKAGRIAATTGRVAGKTATYPVRHPIQTAKLNLAAQIPAAVTSGDPLGQFKKVLEGQGVVGNVLGDIGSAVSDAAPSEIAGNLIKDVFDLPAQVLPSIYLPLAGIVEAAQGDSSRLDSLWNSYKATGLFPAIFSGNPDKVLSAIKNHPLFTALEARGAQAVVGRSAGALARAAGSEAGSTIRPPLRLGGKLDPQERTYSKDLIEKTFQVASDRRRAAKRGGQKASPRERSKILRERVDRIVSQEEGARRAGRAEASTGALEARPKRKVDQEGVGLATRGIITSPRTFHADLIEYAKTLDKSAEKLRSKIEQGGESGGIAKDKLAQNRELRSLVERVATDGSPEAIFASSRSNVKALRATDEALVKKGVLDPRQAAQARLISFARTRLGAKHGLSNETKAKLAEAKAKIEATSNSAEKRALRGQIKSLKTRKQIIDSKGDALGPEKIDALRKELRAEEPGFISDSPSARGPGSFYRSFSNQRATINKGARTGKAAVQGTFDPSYAALAEQRVRGQGIVDAINGFDRMVSDSAISLRRFKTYKDAQEAARHPAAFGLPKNLDLKPVRLAPLRASSREVKTAESIFEQLDNSNQHGMEATVNRLFEEAQREGDGPVVLMPAEMIARFREHVQAASTGRKAMQVISSAFKGVVLPLSPKWLAGNFFDMSLRSLISGTTPYGLNAAIGRKLISEVKRLDPEAGKRVEAGLTPGTLFGAADNTRVFRDARQFNGTVLAPIARALGSLHRSPGIKQVVTLYTRYRDGVFALNEHLIERPAQQAQLGKFARQEYGRLRSTLGKQERALNLGEDAIHDLAKGLLHTPKQIQYAKAIEQTLGQWTANSPGMKAMLTDYMPFGMWARAATRFVFLTLPAKHPIFTAMAAIAYEATQEERDKLGLSLFADQALPGSLQGGIPQGGGGLIPTSSLTSFGYTGDLQGNLASTLLPQFPIQELSGFSWTGEKLTHADGTPLNPLERVGAVIGSTADSYLPFVALGKRIADKGPGVVFNPLHPYDPALVEYLRSLSHSRQITVPVSGSDSSTSDAPWTSGKPSSGSTAPWMAAPSGSGGTAPWMK